MESFEEDVLRTTLCFATNSVNAHYVVKRRKTAITLKKVRFPKLGKNLFIPLRRTQSLKTLPFDIVHSEQKGLTGLLYWKLALPY